MKKSTVRGFNPEVKVGPNGEAQFIDQQPLPGMELRDLVEGMSYIEREAYKQKLLNDISDREILVHLINDVNEAEGIDMSTGLE